MTHFVVSFLSFAHRWDSLNAYEVTTRVQGFDTITSYNNHIQDVTKRLGWLYVLGFYGKC